MVDDVGEWQPVEYQKQRRAGPTWILPSIITVALLGVIGYSAWTLVPRIFGNSTPTPPVDGVAMDSGTPTTEAGVADATTVPAGEPQVAVSESPAIEEPSPTPLPPTATPSPMPPVVNQYFGTVTSTYGVNARIAPTVDAEIIRILEQGETFFILEQRDDGWLEIFVIEPGTELGPEQPIDGRVGYASAEYFAIAEQPLLEEFAIEILTAAGRAPTPEPEPTVPPTPGQEVGATPAVGLPTVTPVSESQPITTTTQPTVTRQASVTVVVDVAYGLNVRVQPNLNSDIVALLENGTTVQAVSRYADNQWVLVALGDGAQGWVFVDFATVNGDVNSLPLTTSGELPAPTPTPTLTLTPEVSTDAEPIEPPAPYTSTLPADSPAVIVPSISGVNAREAPDTEAAVLAIVPQNAALRARARSTDGQWVQVELPDGALAWVFRDTVVATSDITTLPIVDGSTGATQEAAPTAAPTTVPEGESPGVDEATDSERHRHRTLRCPRHLSGA